MASVVYVGLGVHKDSIVIAVAREGLFFRSCARLHPRTGTPVTALLYQGLWSMALAFSGSYSRLLTYTTFASVFFGGLTVAAVFRLRRTQPDRPRPYRCWFYPVTPALYLLIAAAFLLHVIQGDRVASGWGSMLVLSGLPFYCFWKRSR